MNLRVTETAFAELTEIADYIANDNPAAARAVVVRIEQVFRRLAAFPHMGHAIDESGVRIFPALPFPYLVFYTADENEIVIRNVRHGRRQRGE
jgi:plasmid stabilization system protein ParE